MIMTGLSSDLLYCTHDSEGQIFSGAALNLYILNIKFLLIPGLS